MLFLLFVLFVLDQSYNSLVSARLAVRYRLVKLGGIAGSQDAGQRFNLASVRMPGVFRAGQKSTCRRNHRRSQIVTDEVDGKSHGRSKGTLVAGGPPDLILPEAEGV